MNTINELENSLPQKGRVVWLGIRTKTRGPVKEVSTVDALEDQGLEGDHYSGKPGSKRQVTLIQQEHLNAVANIMQCEEIDPTLVRRNIVVSGINLLAIKNRDFQIGETVFEGTGICAPCSRMEENLGPGGWNAMRGHGGITARVLQAGNVSLGDTVSLKLTKEPGK